ncbi:MAG: FGGY family carbohydrate kinase [Hespellia sp.]|nr:FGGY family carbohydrate kinase [Hespellia sp.]
MKNNIAKTILTIDVGTSSMRGILFSSAGRILHSSQTSYFPTCNEDTSEISAATLSDALLSVCKNCASFSQNSNLEICGLSLTSQRSSFLPIDKDGLPLSNFITWQDRRCLPICSSLKDYNDSIFEKTGLFLSHIPLAPKLMWYILNQPELEKKTARYLTIADYLLHFMTGEYKTDYTYGSRTLLMDIHTLSWDDDLLRLFHVKREKLCKLVPQGSIIGTLTESFAKLSGLTSGLPVVSAGGDQQCSTLGALCVNAGDMLITVGTGSYVAALTDKMQLDNNSIICGVSAIPGQYQLEATILAGADIFNWYHKTFYSDCSDYDNINMEISASPIGANGLIALPHFRGKGSPNWNPNATGLFYGVNSDCRRGDFARSIIEGIAFEIAENLAFLGKSINADSKTEHAFSKNQDSANVIRIAGGLTNSPVLNQIITNICGHQIESCTTNETTAVGAFLSARVALGFSGNFQDAVSTIHTQHLEFTKSHTYYPDTASMVEYEVIKEKRKKIYADLFTQ